MAGVITAQEAGLLSSGLWPSENLPPPDRIGYQYAVDMGLVRTAFEGGQARQRRLYLNQPAQFRLSWTLTTRQVAIFGVFCANIGYTWFSMEIPTIQSLGASEDPTEPDSYVSEVTLRFITNYRVSGAGFDKYKVEVNAEAASLEAAKGVVTQFYWSDDGVNFYWPDDGGPFYRERN